MDLFSLRRARNSRRTGSTTKKLLATLAVLGAAASIAGARHVCHVH